MSVFDKVSRSSYVETMRLFLGKPKKGFLQEAGLVDRSEGSQVGRARRYQDEPVRRIEEEVNAKAARVEARDTTLGERIRLARDYAFLSDSELARILQVSRELVRRWGADINHPTDLVKLANVLQVPEAWLRTGDSAYLPADATLGVRVGEAASSFREELYALTIQVIEGLNENMTEPEAQAFLEHAVKTTPALAQAARKAGGRWQILDQSLFFVPWLPVAESTQASGKAPMWSTEVEEIIQQELATQPTVYKAWDEMKKRCEEKGLAYPQRITLFKRVQHDKERVERFGLDINDLIKQSVAKHEAFLNSVKTKDVA